MPPRSISAAEGNAKPAYPAEAQRHQWQGRVVLHVEVSAGGTPTSVHVLFSSGHPLLDEAALHAVEKWRFTPATQGGAPVPGAVDVPVQFRLEE